MFANIIEKLLLAVVVACCFMGVASQTNLFADDSGPITLRSSKVVHDYTFEPKRIHTLERNERCVTVDPDTGSSTFSSISYSSVSPVGSGSSGSSSENCDVRLGRGAGPVDKNKAQIA